ncbi:hypothetical protein AO366_1970 [Moraxella catarrhalis]|uniref:Uncharacterized protein n=1 Tax=Moraxella catarrhalis TaxID=480 RepID=A0A198XEC2_MORCA|nr:hypothetical protein [Moraxella catarrhalis]OAV08360.1 hypothetical protein AO380_0920 [Moraxella catarrhalis]OAV28095.1 hypothetical protein AO370_0258 [Moraxella catarrhalis]OAV30453.1 hypothetical protein AO367_1047 [Moraxella catarrhalis]OAV31106.1 hypothetical protein AO366_1970 [Moraxella catarrhalis]OAV34338.1 hypothetical protein AO364_1723 [Moraxella catarrhalis]
MPATLDQLSSDIETIDILKLTVEAHKALAELKGLAMKYITMFKPCTLDLMKYTKLDF